MDKENINYKTIESWQNYGRIAKIKYHDPKLSVQLSFNENRRLIFM